MLLLLSVAVLFSLHQVSVRWGTLRADSILLGTFVSLLTTTILFLAISAFVFKAEPPEFFEMMVLAGLIHFMLARTAFYQCISRLGANVAATLATTRIFFAAVLGYLMLGESVSLRLAVTAFLVFLGVAVLTFRVVRDFYGIALGILTGFLTAFASIFAKEGMVFASNPVSGAIFGTAVGYVSALLVFSVTFLPSKSHRKFDLSLYPFALGGVFVGFGHFLRYLALSHYGVCLVETFVSTYPLFTYALSGLFLREHEVFSLRFFISAFLILTGIFIL